MRTFTLISFIVFFLLPNIGVFSQNNNFRQWSVEDGLPQSNIYCIIQDQRGYLWLGTGGGACLFDGKNFKTFTKKDGLSGNIVRSSFEDSKGRLWFGTDEGITVFDGYNFKVIDNSDGLSGSTVLCFLEDAKNNIWAGTDDGGINQITIAGKDSILIRHFGNEEGLSSNTVFDIFQDDGENIWAATFGGVNLLVSTSGEYEIQTIRGKHHIPSDRLLSVSADKKGGLWFGTYDAGAFKIDLNREPTALAEVTSYNTSSGLNGNSVWDILVTKSGEIWHGTAENGINRFIARDENSEYIIKSYTSEQGVSGNQILCLFEDNEENIWIGTNGDGLSMFAGDHFTHYTPGEGFPNKVQHIEQDSMGNYWLASDGGGLSVMSVSGPPALETYTEKEGLASNFITSLAMGRADNPYLWIGTTNRGIMKFNGVNFFSYTEEHGLISDRINNLLVDSKGILWCGTANGISRYDGIKFLNVSTGKMIMKDEGVKTIVEDTKGNIWFGMAGGLARYTGDGQLRTFDEKEGLMHSDVNTIAEDAEGNIWIGTNGGGLYKFNIAKNDTNAITFVTDDNLLASNSIHALIFENDYTLIVGTYKGFDKVSLDEAGNIVRVRNYNSSDGFAGVECNDNAVYKDRDGNIWFGTVKGASRYIPALDRNKALVPHAYITGLQLFYESIDWSAKTDSVSPWFGIPRNLKLPYDQNNLTFQFAAISLSNPHKIKFRYKLEGWDEDWSPVKNEAEVTFSGLSHGNYTFRVKARNALGNWSEPAGLAFTINPPWYQTLWFYFICVILCALFIFIFIKYRERKLKEEKRILETVVAERTKEVVMQKEQIYEKSREITDSINYAKGIQEAILPTEEFITTCFPESFVLFKPKDIVSGDFYWMEKTESKTFFASVDCTGHGVPGAFVSMVGANGLNRSVKEYGITEPAEILDRLSALVEETFSKRKDGMDIALCAINTQNALLEFSGANNPLYLLRGTGVPLIMDGNVIQPIMEQDGIFLYEIKGDKQPIGSFDGRKNFINRTLQLQQKDIIYLFTDGYADQFGGPKGKKFRYGPFKKLFISIHSKPLNEQKEILDQTIESWKGKLEQIDDICIVGVKI